MTAGNRILIYTLYNTLCEYAKQSIYIYYTYYVHTSMILGLGTIYVYVMQHIIIEFNEL